MEFTEDDETFVDQRNGQVVVEEDYYEDDTFKGFGEDIGPEEDLIVEVRI